MVLFNLLTNKCFIYILEVVYINDKALLPYIAYFLFGLILFTFSWLTEEPSHLRIEITFITAILIVIGEYHEVSNFCYSFVKKITVI